MWVSGWALKMLSVFALLLALLHTIHGSPCPLVTSCICTFTINKAMTSFEPHANCTSTSLTKIPAQLPHKLIYLEFSDNNLLPENIHSLCEFPFLKHASLSHNHLSTLPSGQLLKCNSLSSLTLTGNNFDFLAEDSFNGVENIISMYGLETRKITGSAFSKLSKLKQLSLALYQSDIPAELLDGLQLVLLTINIKNALSLPAAFLNPVNSTLVTLSIRSNSIQSLSSSLLSGQSRLEKIILKMSDIHSLPSELFKEMATESSLQHIHISRVRSLPRVIFNHLDELVSLEIHEVEDMPADLFQGLLSLKKLNLSNCYIGYGQVPPGWFCDLWSVTTLSLQHTNLDVVEQVDFDGLESLKVLDLSHNSIRTVKGGTFAHVSDTLQELRLNNNLLGTLSNTAFKGIYGLRVLDLSYNKLFELADDVFANLEQLEYLNLHENKLFAISGDSFQDLHNLKELDIGDNIIRAIPIELFDKTESLEKLNLASNRLSAIYYAYFAGLHSLVSLNVDHNPIICSCSLVELRERLIHTDIKGICESNGILHTISHFEYFEECVWTTSTTTMPTTTSPASKIVTVMPMMYSISSYSSSSSTHKSEPETTSTTAIPTTTSPASKIATIMPMIYSTSSYSSSSSTHKSEPETTSTTAMTTTSPTSKITTIMPMTYSTSSYSSSSSTHTSEPETTSITTMPTTTSTSKTTTTVPTIYSASSYSSSSTTHTSIQETSMIATKSKNINITSTALYISHTVHTLTDTPVEMTSGIDKIVATPTIDVITEDVTNKLEGVTKSVINIDNAVTGKDNNATVGIQNSLANNSYDEQNVPVMPFLNETEIGNTEFSFEGGDNVTQAEFYMAVAFICSITAGCVAIIAFLVYRKRRSGAYTVAEETFDPNIFFESRSGPSDENGARVLKGVPSLQIESVDDEGNIHVTEYAAQDIPVFIKAEASEEPEQSVSSAV